MTVRATELMRNWPSRWPASDDQNAAIYGNDDNNDDDDDSDETLKIHRRQRR